MSTLHYIDNEVPAFGEWDSVVGSIVQSADAAWPDRGDIGLRVTVSGANAAYAQKDSVVTLPAGGSVYVGVWICLPAYPSDSTYILTLDGSGIGSTAHLQLAADGKVRIDIIDDAGNSNFGQWSTAIATNRWTYIVLRLVRATTNIAADGCATAYIDGTLCSSKTDIDNYDRNHLSNQEVTKNFFINT